MIMQVDVPYFNDDGEKTFWMDAFHLGMVDGHGVSSSIVAADVALKALHVRALRKINQTQSGLLSGLLSGIGSAKAHDYSNWQVQYNQDVADIFNKTLGNRIDPTAPSAD